MLEALNADRGFLTAGGVFSDDFIDNWIEKTDPIPDDFYDLSKNLVILARNPKVLTKFAQMPEVVCFLTDPSLIGLVTDPVIMKHYGRGEYERIKAVQYTAVPGQE